MENIDCVLLVDDSISTNFYHKKIIQVSGDVKHVHDVENGLEALDYIGEKGKFKDKHPLPNIILLDINMPKMDGFEFLDHFSKLEENKRENTIIVFLTTSNWAKDKVKALENDLVYDFIEKPLTKKSFAQISEYYKSKFLVV